MKTFAAILLGFGILLQGVDKLPVPDAATQKKNEKVVRELLKDAYQKKDQNSRRQLARALFEAGIGEKDPELAFAFFRETADVAAAAMDFTVAMSAVEKLEKAYRVEPETPLTGATFSSRHEIRKAVFKKVQKSAQSLEDAGAYVKAALKLADLYFSEDAFDDCVAAAQMADSVALGSSDKGLQSLVRTYLRSHTVLKQEHDRVAKAHLRVLSDPADVEAAQAWGLFLAFVLGDWNRAVEWLAKGKDGSISEVARKELGKAPAAELADQWLGLADKAKDPDKGRYQRRAHYWALEAVGTASGADRLKLQKKLDDLDKIMGITDLIKLADPGRDYIGKGQGKGGFAKLDGSKLVLEGGSFQNGLIEFPYAPPAEYVLTIVARHAGGEFRPLGIGLAVGDRQWAVLIGINNPVLGAIPGIQNVDGKAVSLDDEARTAAVVSPGQPITCVFTVRPSGFSVSVNGIDIIDWAGDSKRLSVPDSMGVSRKNTLFMCATASRYEIEKALVVPVAGHGLKLR